MGTEIAIQAPADKGGTINVFGSANGFEAAQRMAKGLASSSLVPTAYQGNVANCLIALELASRIGTSTFMVMQHLHVIQGRPSFSASFQIATVNACGRFTPLRFEEVGELGTDTYGMRAVATDKASGEALIGDSVTWAMVKAEGWLSKSGSKWKTMPGQMFRYRAAAFWARVYAPELLMGLATADEVEEVAAPVERAAQPSTPALSAPSSRVGMSALEAALAEDIGEVSAEDEERARAIERGEG